MNKKSFRVVLLTYFAVAFFVIMAFGSEYLSENIGLVACNSH